MESSQIGTNRTSKETIDKNDQIEQLTQSCNDYANIHQDMTFKLSTAESKAAELKMLLQLCVDDMYSPSGKIKKKTAIKLMAACQKGIVDFPQ